MERRGQEEGVPPAPAESGPTQDSAWILDPEVVAERIGGEIVVVHLRTNKIYELNASAARIFELMRQGAGRAALESALVAEYEVEPSRLAASLDRLVSELRAAKIVR